MRTLLPSIRSLKFSGALVVLLGLTFLPASLLTGQDSPAGGGQESGLEVGATLDNPLPPEQKMDLYRPGAMENTELPTEPTEPIDPKELLDEELGTDEDFTGGEALTLSGKEEGETISTNRSEPGAPTSTVTRFETSDTSAIMQSILDEFEQLEDAVFFAQNTKMAARPAFRYRGKLYHFQLYFVQGAEAVEEGSRDLRELADYFFVEPQRARAISQAALIYVQKLLEENEFQIFTNWEKISAYEEDSPHYAFIYIAGRPLGEYLVENGLVRLGGERSLLPEGTSIGDHLRTLRDLELQARNNDKGGWKQTEQAKFDDVRFLD